MGKKAFVVIGLGFGDEGKGLVTDYLCQRSSRPLVVRFNGGHQAGHTVITKEGDRHVFSCFGSGTFRGAPTYWSKFCTFSPEAVWNEFLTLKVKPFLLVDRLCPVTTHYDLLYNQAIEATRGSHRHGSCGVGFGATIERNKIDILKFQVQDLQFPGKVKSLLKSIRLYYQEKINKDTKFDFSQFNHDLEDQNFIRHNDSLTKLSQNGAIRYVDGKEVFSNNQWETYIFEGAQGVLLDMNSKFFPHVTHSNTTSKNAIDILNTYLTESIETEVFYVTRCYQTRHGAGPFESCSDLFVNSRGQETNHYNENQGEFKVNYLDIDSLNYSLEYDSNFSLNRSKHIVITCLDQIQNSQFYCYKNGVKLKMDYTLIPDMLNTKFTSSLFSFSSCADDLE